MPPSVKPPRDKLHALRARQVEEVILQPTAASPIPPDPMRTTPVASPSAVAPIVPAAPRWRDTIALVAEMPEAEDDNGSGIVGTIFTFKSMGDPQFIDRNKVSMPANFLGQLIDIREARVHWGQDNLIDRRIWREPDKPFPLRNELDDQDPSKWPISPFNDQPTDPWQIQIYGLFNDMANGQPYTFIAKSSGSQIAMRELAAAITHRRERQPKAYAIVTLGYAVFSARRQINRPQFKIVRWVDYRGQPLPESELDDRIPD